jgi:outer membrane protein
MNKKIFIIGLVSLLCFSLVKGQDTETVSLSLKQAREYALNNNYEVKNAQIDIVKSKKKVWETTAIGLPNVSGSLSYQNTFEVPEITTVATPALYDPVTGEHTGHGYEEASLKFGEPQTTTYSFTVSQLIFSGEYIVGLQAARTYKLLSDQSLQQKQIDVIDAINSAYYTALMVKENYNILDSSYQNTMQIANEMEEMFKVGLIEETEVTQLKLTASNIKNSMLTIKRQHELALDLLKLNIGMDINKNILLTDDLETFSNEAVSSAGAGELNLESNIDYKLLETQEKLSELSLKREKSTILPSISGFYQHLEYVDEPAFTFQQPDMIGVNVSVPIFASGSRHSKIQQAKLNLEQTRNLKQMATEGIKLEYNRAKADYESALEKFTIEKENVKLSKKIYNNTLEKFKNGTSSSLELTQINNQYLTNQSNYHSAIFELLNAKSKLDKVLNKF